MRMEIVIAVSAIALLAGCSDASNEEVVTERVTTVDMAESEAPQNESGFMEAMEQPSPPSVAPPPPPPAPPVRTRSEGADTPEEIDHAGGTISVGIPQVAYSFAYGFRVPADTIRPLQERHADMCEAKGQQVCRIVSMNQGEQEGDYAYGSLTIAVRSSEARSFGKALTAATGQMEGELISSSIEGEDLSKRIVDTEARLRARTVLRDRLMEVLRNRQGTVSELVAAERGVAQVNEEIDQAQSWLSEMRARVAYSTMTVEYQAGAPAQGGFIDPIRSAWGSLASLLGNMIAVFMVLLTVILPLGLIVWLAVRLWRRSGFSTGIGNDGWLPKSEPEAENAS
ncbi:DUF4349 domain-containing protein [Qipengyuania sp. 6B39]|uniref:DUF4349 domain-containing protein n=1 Tax=Qipengyuania proteolytica TaxID=2867239 RepID=UPI001C894901|nr:DUF4349 domain-containing protein [Qipengyuania proteolytica]MBX7496547.1 DUF4349 domain-containing protein [Qipengyuania proteolytica]